MSAKTPLHVSPSSHALRAYLFRCVASSFPEEPQTLQWADVGAEYIARIADWEETHERLGAADFARQEGEYLAKRWGEICNIPKQPLPSHIAPPKPRRQA